MIQNNVNNNTKQCIRIQINRIRIQNNVIIIEYYAIIKAYNVIILEYNVIVGEEIGRGAGGLVGRWRVFHIPGHFIRRPGTKSEP